MEKNQISENKPETNHFCKGLTFMKFLCWKNSKIVFLFISFIFLTNGVRAQTWPPEDIKGDGTSNNPWEITTAAHLEALALRINAALDNELNGKYYKLMNDIDLSDYPEWNPIGDYNTCGANGCARFNGYFDGNNKVIKNLAIYCPGKNYRGFFGYVEDSRIEDLGIEDCMIIGYNESGGLAGAASRSDFSNCYTTGVVGGGQPYDIVRGGNMGGLIGQIGACNIYQCFSTVEIVGNIVQAGGLVGASYTSNINECYATGNVVGQKHFGGLVGFNTQTIIKNCYATGNIIGSKEHYTTECYNAGGLVGWNYEGSFISHCYATGKVVGRSRLGGLVGDNSAIIINCVAANDSIIAKSNFIRMNRIVGYSMENSVSDNNYARSDMFVNNSKGNVTITDGDDLAGVGMDVETLQIRAFYHTRSNWYDNEVWDIVSSTGIWDICENKTLPFLRWQGHICAPTDIKEISKSCNLVVYPNPANDKFMIAFDKGGSLKLYDILGREVLAQNIFGKTEINIAHLPKGIYLIRLISDGEIVGNSKIMKQ